MFNNKSSLNTKNSGLNQAVEYREKIIDEIFYNFGLARSGLSRRLFGPLFRLPAARFGQIAAIGDTEVKLTGLPGGSRRILPELLIQTSARGAYRIPSSGPLIVASNHSGAFDSIAILACIPRKDVKVLITDVAFTRALQFASQYFIYVPQNGAGRLEALRSSIEHLRDGGALLIFASGDVEPDPELSPDAGKSIINWSRSLEIMLRKIPEAWLQVAIVSGVILSKFMNCPLVRIRKTAPQRQKLAEVLQIIFQMLLPEKFQTHVNISFAEAVPGKSLANEGIMSGIVRVACSLLEDHLSSLQVTGCL